jgi:hypothetical protein
MLPLKLFKLSLKLLQVSYWWLTLPRYARFCTVLFSKNEDVGIEEGAFRFCTVCQPSEGDCRFCTVCQSSEGHCRFCTVCQPSEETFRFCTVRRVCYLTNILLAIRYGAQNFWRGIKIQNIKKELTPTPLTPMYRPLKIGYSQNIENISFLTKLAYRKCNKLLSTWS